MTRRKIDRAAGSRFRGMTRGKIGRAVPASGRGEKIGKAMVSAFAEITSDKLVFVKIVIRGFGGTEASSGFIHSEFLMKSDEQKSRCLYPREQA
jgi:hypothetical protein